MLTRSPFERFSWHSDIFDCQSTDIARFYLQLEEEVQRLGLSARTLGKAGSHPVTLYQSPAQKAQAPNLLISSGFHGEEAAGPWGMLHFLSGIDASLFERVNLSLLPLVNPTGFSRGHRFNLQGQNPNRGYALEGGRPASNDDTSDEGKLLLEHARLLQAASRDGILTCHEDVLEERTYVYSFEPSQLPGQFSLRLRDALGHYFPLAMEGEIDGLAVKDGVIFNHFDTSFESFLVRSGARFGMCSETPGKQVFDQRVLANSAVMAEFLALLAPEVS
ncbi:N-acetyl-ornithine deacetylase [Shewanella cyperi]|uniref:N-acetyl-ornithine deacetylase n=1 Tax=Shewanella cyperi TaxID=2814292 RepID=UPI001A952CC7|nr:M14 family metallocarboxypeptidase [Shewanella cyperi]QSX40138.1 M14 family metallocarboxypeptidase [Shewanella cyperi]